MQADLGKVGMSLFHKFLNFEDFEFFALIIHYKNYFIFLIDGSDKISLNANMFTNVIGQVSKVPVVYFVLLSRLGYVYTLHHSVPVTLKTWMSLYWIN